MHGKTFNEVTIHISFYSRFKMLFTLNSLTSVKFEKHYRVFLCCGKVMLRDRNNRSIVGYIMDEDAHHLHLHLENDTSITINMPVYNTTDRKHVLNYRSSNGWSIAEYHPIRMKVNRSGRLAVMFTTITYKVVDDKYVII